MADRALIIANGNYLDWEFEATPSATVSSGALAGVLADPRSGSRFTVGFLNDVVRSTAAQTLESFFIEAGPDDLVWLHVAGHARYDEHGGLHFAMADTQARYPGSTAIAEALLDEWMSRCPSRRIVVTLDCRYSGAEGDVDLASAFTRPGRFVIAAPASAASGGDTVPRGSSPVRGASFTDAIATGIRTRAADGDRDGSISARELYEYLVAEARAVPGRQEPELAVDTVQHPVVLAAPVDMQAPQPVQPHRHRSPTERPTQPDPLATPVKRRGLLYGGIAAGAAVAAGGAYALIRRSDPNGGWDMQDNTIESEYKWVQAGAISQDRTVFVHTRVPIPLAGEESEEPIAIVVREFGSWKETASFPTWIGYPPMALSQDGGLLSVARMQGQLASDEAFIELWDTGSGEKTGEVAVQGSMEALAFHPDSSSFASGGHAGLARIWDTASLEMIAEFDRGIWASDPAVHSIDHVSYSPDGAYLVVGEGYADFIGITDARTFEPVSSFTLPGGLYSMEFSPDGSLFAAAVSTDDDGSAVLLFDSGSMATVWAEYSTLGEFPGSVLSLAFSPDGSMLAAGIDGPNPNDGGGSGILRLWDTATSEQSALVDTGGYPTSLAFIDNESFIVVTGSLELWSK